MSRATVIHYDPPLDKKKAKDFSIIEKFIKDNDIHVVSFIFAYDGFYEYAEKDFDVELENKKVEEFIKKNDYIDNFENHLFDVDKNPKFNNFVVGFQHDKLKALLSLIKRELIEDVRFWKEKKVMLLVNVHEQQVYEL